MVWHVVCGYWAVDCHLAVEGKGRVAAREKERERGVSLTRSEGGHVRAKGHKFFLQWNRMPAFETGILEPLVSHQVAN